MTDYLELLEEGVDALLEQMRRLERAFPNLNLETAAGEKIVSPSFFPKNQILSQAFSTFEGEDVENVLADRLKAEKRSLASDRGEKTERTLPLLEELVRLEWAAAAGEPAPGAGQITSTGLSQRRTSLTAQGGEVPYGSVPGWSAPLLQPRIPEILSRSGGARSQSGGALPLAGGGRDPSGGEMSWAEQADRVFRRDSRRYDGGFYLY